MSLRMMADTAEVVRGGIQSIPRGQTEAARSTGLTGLRPFRPQDRHSGLQVPIPEAGVVLPLPASPDPGLHVLLGFSTLCPTSPVPGQASLCTGTPHALIQKDHLHNGVHT